MSEGNSDYPQPISEVGYERADKSDTRKHKWNVSSWCSTADQQAIMVISKALKGAASVWLSQVSYPGMPWLEFKVLFIAGFVFTETNAAIPDVLSGYASLGVESSDPLFVEKIVANLPLIKYVFYNSTVLGYKNCEISDIKLSTDLKKYHYALSCDNIRVSGKYKISGRLFKLLAEGKGDCHIVSGKYKITIDSEVNKYVGSDGKNHLAIGDFKMETEALSANRFDFKNLFNGDIELSDALHKHAHENWKEVAKQVQYPTWYESLKKVRSNINKYLESVALEDMLIV